MGLFDKIFGKQKINDAQMQYFSTFTAYAPVFTSWNGALYESELVRAAIDARSRHISKLKVEIMGTAKASLQNKLKAAPNAFMSWSQFLYRLNTILDMQNTAFIVPVLDELGGVSGYYPIMSANADLVQNESGVPFIRYRFSNGDTAAIELSMVGIMTKFQYSEDFFGEPNTALNDTLKLIHIQNQGIEEAIKSSSTYRFYARLNNFAKDSDLEKERKRFSEKNFGTKAGAGGMLLFPNNYDGITQITQQPVSVDVEQRKLIQTNVFNYYGVNEDVLQNKVTGDAWDAFYEGAIETFSVQFSDVMTKLVFSLNERARGSEIIATANRLQYMSNKDKMNMIAQMMDRGIFTINEAREILNLTPVEGGDVRTVRGEYKNADEVNKKEEEDAE